MSRRSIVILVATGIILVLLVVLLLVPAPPENVEAIDAIVFRLEGMLVPLFPAAWHTLTHDRNERLKTETSPPEAP